MPLLLNMPSRETCFEMIEEGLQELEEVYSNEKENNDEEEKIISKEIKKISLLREKVGSKSLEDDELINEIEKFSEGQNKLLEIISDKIERYESKDRRELVEFEHDQRHEAMGVAGGVIRYSIYLADEEEQRKHLEKQIRNIKEYSN